MPYGDAAAEQHEKDRPASCLRPDGAKPELEPLKDRQDFIYRVDQEISKLTIAKSMSWEPVDAAKDRPESYYAERIRQAETTIDQLVLLRAVQILEEAEARRRDVMVKFRAVYPLHETPAEITLDDAERRGE